MTDLLTHDEYKAIAAGLTFPTAAFIDGAYRPAASGKTFVAENPATGEALSEIAFCDAEDVDFAVGKAREAFDDGRWSKLHPSERKAVLIRLAKLIKRFAQQVKNSSQSLFTHRYGYGAAGILRVHSPNQTVS